MYNRGAIRTGIGVLAAICLLALPLRAHAQCTLPSDGLVGHWTLDETSGTTANALVGSNGTLGNGMTAGTATTSGQVGTALNFDGTNDYIRVPNFAAINNLAAMTLTAWFKADTLSGVTQRLIHTPSNNFALYINVGNEISFEVFASGNGYKYSEANTGIQPGVWYHVAAVYESGQTLKIYLDGQHRTTWTDIAPVGLINTDSPLIDMGYNVGGANSPLDGVMDDVRIYDRALTAAEITALYNTRATAAAPAGYMAYDAKYARMMYCNGTNWVHAGTGSYNPNAVYFDNSTDYLLKTTDLTGLVDGKQVTGSLWIRRTADLNNSHKFYQSNETGTDFIGFQMQFTSDDYLSISAFNSDETQQLLAAVSTAALFADSQWHHILFSFDLANATGKIYVDGIDRTQINTIVNANIDFTKPRHAVGGQIYGAQFPGDIADFWLDYGTYIDLSIEANRNKFRSAAGLPMYLGADGSLPTGTVPDIFLSGDTANWHTNKGTGGGFTENGALTASSSQPADSLIATGGGPALENHTAAYGFGTATSFTQNLGFTPTAGRLLVAIVGWDKDVTGITEPSGQWTLVTTEASGLSVTGAMYYKVAAGNETSFSLSWTNLRSPAIWIGEFSGVASVAPFDKSTNADSANANVTSMSTGTTAALVQANELAIAMVAVDTGSNLDNGPVWSNGFRELFGCPYCDDPGLRVAYKNVSSTAGVTTTYSATDTGDQAIAILATFKASGTESDTACSSSSKGKMLYDFGFNVMKYCNGAEWVAMGPVGGAVSTTGLAGHWKLDETSGATVADSAGARNGAWTDGANNDVGEEDVTGQLGGAINFAGSKRVTITGEGAAFSMNQFTTSTWIYRTSDTGLVEVVLENMDALDDGWTMLISAADTLRCGYNATVTNTPATIPITVNRWWHFACVSDGTTIYTYINGVLADAERVSGSIAEATNMRIGSRSFNTGFPFTGYIDDVRVYNRALTANEVRQLYNYGASGGLGDVSASCSDPASSEGTMIYNTTHDVMQYCNGEKWIGIGR